MNTTRDQITDRIQQINHDAREISRRMWLAGLGTVSTVDEAGRSLWSELVERGKKAEKARGDIAQNVRDAGDKINVRVTETRERFERGVEESMTTVLHRLGAPTRQDVEQLIDRVEKLTLKVESLQKA